MEWLTEVAAIIGIFGGVGAGLLLIVRITKVIDGQLEAMRENTDAVKSLTRQMIPLYETLEDHDARLSEIEPVVFPTRIPRPAFRPRRNAI